MPDEQALATLSSRQVAGILDAIPAPAAIVRRDFTIVSANRAYHTAYLRGGGSCVGRPCHLVAHRRELPCSATGSRCPIEHWTTGAPCVQVTHEHRTVLGTRWEDVTAYPIADERGRTTVFLELVRAQAAEGRSPDCGHTAEAVGQSPAILQVRSLIARVARTETPVLLLGESGTGKELAAAAIHARSERRDGPLVPLDCSSVPGTLFETELFGHERGAFTGASQSKRGLVEAAAGGTLFLDEVGDIPLPFQVKLLRLIEAGTYRRVGSTETRRATFRLVCATHRDLEAMVVAGTFRRDLFYRISAFPIAIPPLRERLTDIPLLAEYLLDRIAPGGGLRLHHDALALLLRYTFPGNVRELHNILQRAALLADDGVILPRHLPFVTTPRAAETAIAAFRLDEGVVPLDEAERRYLRWALTRCSGARGELANRLGISERTLFRKLSLLRSETPVPHVGHPGAETILTPTEPCGSAACCE